MYAEHDRPTDALPTYAKPNVASYAEWNGVSYAEWNRVSYASGTGCPMQSGTGCPMQSGTGCPMHSPIMGPTYVHLLFFPTFKYTKKKITHHKHVHSMASI